MEHKYIVYVDESGDESAKQLDPDYPIFVLAFCIFEIDSYVNRTVPMFQSLKFHHFGHDAIVLHESEIRRQSGDFAWLSDSAMRSAFLTDLSECIDKSEFAVFPTVIEKSKSQQHEVFGQSLDAGLAGLNRYFLSRLNEGDEVWIVFESRGIKEDRALLRDFDLLHRHRGFVNFQIRFAPKTISSTGLQIADLIARPIGLNYLRPGQPNRSFDLIRDKLI